MKYKNRTPNLNQNGKCTLIGNISFAYYEIQNRDGEDFIEILRSFLDGRISYESISRTIMLRLMMSSKAFFVIQRVHIHNSC